MKTRGRPQSKNIDDRRSYFGSDTVDPNYWIEDRIHDFLMDTLHNPVADMPQELTPRDPLDIKALIQNYINDPNKIGLYETPGHGGYGIVDQILGTTGVVNGKRTQKD